MKIQIICIGHSKDSWIKEGMEIYSRKLNNYIKYDWIELPKPRGIDKLPKNLQLEAEAEVLQKKIDTLNKGNGEVWRLDESGRQYSSVEWANIWQDTMNRGVRNVILTVGGAYGYSESFKKSNPSAISFSRMTFNHQMFRLLVLEQLYRGFSILKGEKYHH